MNRVPAALLLAIVVQWDIVKSVVKSVAGLQGRKFKVGCPAGVRRGEAV